MKKRVRSRKPKTKFSENYGQVFLPPKFYSSFISEKFYPETNSTKGMILTKVFYVSFFSGKLIIF